MQTSCESTVSPESALVYRARTGDATAFDDLVVRYHSTAVRIARSFVRDRDLSEDVAQEAFVRTFLAIRRLRESDAFLRYLTRAIVRICIDCRTSFLQIGRAGDTVITRPRAIWRSVGQENARVGGMLTAGAAGLGGGRIPKHYTMVDAPGNRRLRTLATADTRKGC